METITDLQNRLKTIVNFDILKDINLFLSSENTLSQIEELNKKQLLEGKTNKGNEVRPFYSEDPYFKTKEAAFRYAKWKKKITPNPLRALDVPNLYIIGYFHSSIKASFSSYVKINSTVPLGQKLINKYKDILGLTENNLDILRAKYLQSLTKKIKSYV